MSAPDQYISFNAFQVSTGNKGSVTYTNFTYPLVGTGVWALSRSLTIEFAAYGGLYDWAITVDSILATSNSAYTFSGSASDQFGAATTATVTGSVSGTSVLFHMLYTSGAYAGFTLDATGSINQVDGSVIGTSFDSLGRTLTWTMSGSTAFEVLSYKAPVSGVTISGTTASFIFTVPTTLVVSFAGLAIPTVVTDEGSPGAGNDAISLQGIPYNIVGGNLVVH